MSVQGCNGNSTPGVYDSDDYSRSAAEALLQKRDRISYLEDGRFVTLSQTETKVSYGLLSRGGDVEVVVTVEQDPTHGWSVSDYKVCE